MTKKCCVMALMLALLFPLMDGTAQTTEKEKAKGEKSATKTGGDETVGKTADGRPVYAGSRGGHYYLTASGNKTYVDEFVGAKIVGKTKDGRKIYEGPKSGRYYYNANGNKTYVPKDGK